METRGDRRPYAASPALHDEVGRLAWQDAGTNCLSWFTHPVASPLNAHELALAAGFCLWRGIDRGGFNAWLFNRQGGNDILAATVPALYRIGAVGMAGHIDRSLEACLGPSSAWRELRGQAWDAYLDERMHVLRARLALDREALKTVRVSLRDMKMTPQKWRDFIFACEKELAETGSSPQYRQWFERRRMEKIGWRSRIARRLANWRRGVSSSPPAVERAHRIQVALDEKDGRAHYCYSFDDPLHAGEMGYHYWEAEFLAKSHDYALASLDHIRPAYRPC